ncbi:M15 family peptidase [Nocardioides cavernaquae]|uniref:M15 family peptidase n=1 Tax=Nocardioides cavernaquae TaxID=2321396 RepID=A0A3A5HCV5_9ACTN|nr:M15 family peptidase [Nocardioides cavernaquae]
MAALALCTVMGACGGEAPKKTAAKPSRTPSPAVSVPVFDDDHSMPQPPALEGAVARADILIYDTETLSSSMVKRIEGIDGVFATDVFSMANTPIQGDYYNVAAVDPATYRRFTLAGKQDAIWSRVAAGEMAISSPIAPKVEDEEHFVPVGVGDAAQDVHVGAYVEHPKGIDLVVNEEWGEDLFKVEGNAMLISTLKRSPQSIRKPLEKIVGKDAAIQMLDIASVLGLNPGAPQVAIATSGSVGAAIGIYRYRVVGNQVIPESSWTASHLRTETMPLIGRVTCNTAMLPQLRAALNDVVAQGLSEHVYQTAGCFNARFIAGSTRLSNHAFGMAIDLNSLENGRGIRGQMNPSVVKIFEKWGFAWGGTWKYTDPMHFELVRIVKVG